MNLWDDRVVIVTGGGLAVARSQLRETQCDLPARVRIEAITLLNWQLADTLDLRLQAKQAHWNVRGPSFMALRELFNRVGGELERYADDIAERAVALGGIAFGTARTTAFRSRLPEYPLQITSGPDRVTALSAALACLGETTRAAIEAAAALGDRHTASLFVDLSRALDRLAWKVEAHNA